MKIDTEELSRGTFRCIEGCGFCCLCPAGLTGEEAARLSANPRTRGGVEVQLAGRGRAEAASLKLANGTGACVFLSPQRACGIYEERPRPCRSFPYSTHVLEGVQVSLNRGCPGTWPEAMGTAAEASFQPDSMLGGRIELRAAEARAVFDRFRAHAESLGRFASVESLRRGLGWIPDALDLQTLLGAISALDLGQTVKRPPPPANPRALTRAKHQILRAAFAATRPLDLPIRVNRELGWEAYRMRGPRIERFRLTADGGLHPAGELSWDAVDWLPAESGGLDLARAYAGTLLARDHLYGLACHVVDGSGYSISVGAAFEREYWNALADLWLRASILSRFSGEETIEKEQMREGIAFFDMDFLDSPSIGAVL